MVYGPPSSWPIRPSPFPRKRGRRWYNSAGVGLRIVVREVQNSHQRPVERHSRQHSPVRAAHHPLVWSRPASALPLSLSARWPGGSAIRRSEEHTSELKSLMRISYAVFFFKKKKKYITKHQ